MHKNGFELLIQKCQAKRVIGDCSICTCTPEECRKNVKLEMIEFIKEEFSETDEKHKTI